ncbi:MAG: transposase [Candidatus Hadarchaeum sp.]
MIRLGVVSGKGLIVDSALLAAWYQADPGTSWQQYARKNAVFGYKVHAALYLASNLPVFVLVTPAHVHDSLVGWFILLVAAVLYGFQVLVVYADAAYFDRRFFRVVQEFLGAHRLWTTMCGEPANASWRPCSSWVSGAAW